MDVRRRNRLIATFHNMLYGVPLVALGWILWQAEGRRRPVLFAATLVIFAAAFVVSLWWKIRFGRMMREADDALRSVGIDPDQMVPETPLPIIPRLRLANDRDQLVAGVLFFLLLIFVFVAYYAGWINRWISEPPLRE